MPTAPSWWLALGSAAAQGNRLGGELSLGKVDEYEVAWPDGTKEIFPGGKLDRLVELRKGEPKK